MVETAPDSVERLLTRSREGDEIALEELYRRVEHELRRLARGRLGRMRVQFHAAGADASLESVQLVNDAFLSLVHEDVGIANRSHFLAIAAHKMRRLCCDYARRELALKRGGGAPRAAMSAADERSPAGLVDPTEILALEQAHERLAALDPEQARVVELRFYGGMSDDEIAAVTGISRATVGRRWRAARAFLRRELLGDRIAEAGEER